MENTNGTNQGRDLLFANKPPTVALKSRKDGARGRGDLLYIDQHILKENEMKNVAMVQINHKKAYKMVS